MLILSRYLNIFSRYGAMFLYSIQKQNFKMGCSPFKLLNKNLTFASLNYSGILTSPYEYYQKQDQQEKLMSQTFVQIVSAKYPEFRQGSKFSWQMGSIDTVWKDRFSPVNLVKVGIKQDNTMMNQDQFSKEWERVHKLTIDKIRVEYFQKKYKSQQVQKKMTLQVERCRQFDLFCYKTLMKIIYGISDLKNMGVVSSQKYLKQKTKDFNKPYLSQANKLDKTLSCINKINYDIMFFQQTNNTLINGLKQNQKFNVITRPDSNSIILIKKVLCKEGMNYDLANQIFLKRYQRQLKNKLNQNVTIDQLKERFNYNQDSIFQAFQNFLFINLHISSKKQKNPIQLQQFASQFCKLLKVLPQFQLICGGDFNTKVDQNIFNQYGILEYRRQVKIAPFGINTLSVRKKRTMMQPQRNKAQVLDVATKDFLVTTLQMPRGQIMIIDGKTINTQSILPLLPNTVHPYDHYMVTCQLVRKTQSNSEHK